MQCPRCKKFNSDEDKVCIFCGTRISDVDSKPEDREYEKLYSIYANKEQYRPEKLLEVAEKFEEQGDFDISNEIREYLNSPDQGTVTDFVTDSGTTKSRGKNYKGSASCIWISFFKIVCGLIFVIFVILGAIIGNISRSSAGTFIGIMSGMILGFVFISFMMLFVNLCENMATVADNSATTLYKLDELLKNDSSKKN